MMNKYGWIGVDLFFVLSGFLVSGLLFSEYKKFGSVKPGQFIIRRGFKIYPHFYLFLGLGFLAEGIYRLVFNEPKLEINLSKTIGELLFVQNYVARIWSQTWSLAVEEHFYLGLAATFLVFAGFRKFLNPWFLVPAVVLLLVFVLGERIIIGNFNMKKVGFYYTHLRIDSLAFGVLLAYFNAFYKEKIAGFVQSYRYFLLLFSGLLLLIVYKNHLSPDFPKHDYFTITIGLTLLYLGFGSLLAVFIYTSIYQNLKKIPGMKYLLDFTAWCGYCSYGIYLWHVFVEKYIIDVIEINILKARADEYQIITFPLYIVATLLISYLATEYFETPILKIRDRLVPKRIA